MPGDEAQIVRTRSKPRSKEGRDLCDLLGKMPEEYENKSREAKKK